MQTAFFQTMTLFSGVSVDSLQLLTRVAKQHVYKKGEIILDYLSSGKTFLYVLNGLIKVFKETAEGEEIIIDVLSNTQHCGEMFAFNTNPTDTYEAQSLAQTEVLTIPLDAIKQLMKKDHTMSLNFLQATLEHQQKLNMNMEHLSIQNASQRIGCYVLRLCRHNPPKEGRAELLLPYDKTLLALRLGMRPETFSRALHKLTEQCEVQVDGEKINIPSVGKLVQYVCQHCSKTYPCNEPE